jgi:hypothetical protein
MKPDQETKKKLMAELCRMFRVVADSPDGLAVFRYLHDSCGFAKPSVVLDQKSGEVNLHSTVYNEARRNVYLSLRKYLTKGQLAKIELEKVSYASE